MFVFKHGAYAPGHVLKYHPYKEVAFVGRSNVGKSSLINAVTGQKNLARISKTPGRTQQINYFLDEKQKLYLVDLPGYGFAKADKKMQGRWQYLMDAYFADNPALRKVFILIDARRGILDVDRMMIDYVQAYGHDCSLVLTKCDKKDTVKVEQAEFCTSVTKKTGIEQLKKTMSAL
ncbi:MAG: ribosome biogenesis GTP-binding protein YsxC [Alphaproteobacteria bacterium]|nr:MAG: ribosome biogenesis GTP-binding protein YsxC [Alphaproteobacteria bacterium]